MTFKQTIFYWKKGLGASGAYHKLTLELHKLLVHVTASKWTSFLCDSSIYSRTNEEKPAQMTQKATTFYWNENLGVGYVSLDTT